MINSGHQNTIPLHVWIKAFLLAYLLFGGGLLYFMKFEKKQYIQSESILYTASDSSKTNFISGTEYPDVYILGSSLTEKGLCKFKSLDSSIFKNHIKLHYKIVFKSSAIMSDYNYKIPEILKEKPRYLFIESNIICVNMLNENISPIMNLLWEYSSYLAGIPKRFILSLHNVNLF